MELEADNLARVHEQMALVKASIDRRLFYELFPPANGGITDSQCRNGVHSVIAK